MVLSVLALIWEVWWKLCGVVGDDLQECLTGNTFLTSVLRTEGECFAFLLFGFFLVQCKELRICDFFLQSFKVIREVLLILIGSGSSLNYLFWLLSQKSIFFREKIYKPVWNYSIISKITFCLSHCFPSNISVCLFWAFLVFVHFSKKTKEAESFRGKCGI